MSITSWHASELVAQLSGKTLSGMDKACQFAANQARGKAPVRSGVLKSGIDYRVEAKGNTVTGYVGVKKGKAFYALFVERGVRGRPARPFLRPSVFENATEIVRLIAEG